MLGILLTKVHPFLSIKKSQQLNKPINYYKIWLALQTLQHF